MATPWLSLGLKVPLPDVDQVAVLALPPIVPISVYALPAQIEVLDPAFAVGGVIQGWASKLVEIKQKNKQLVININKIDLFLLFCR